MNIEKAAQAAKVAWDTWAKQTISAAYKQGYSEGHEAGFHSGYLAAQEDAMATRRETVRTANKVDYEHGYEDGQAAQGRRP